MIKLNYSTIFFLLVFIGFKGFSTNPVAFEMWSTPVSAELMPVALLNLPDNELKASKNELFSLAAAEAYAAPPCETVGNTCNDGNPNTNNDKIDADCECRGIAISCDFVEITYELNGGLREDGAAAINVSESDSIELFANLEGVTVTGPNGVVSGNTINNITSAQAGVYTVNGTYKVTTPTSAPIVLSASSADPRAPIGNAFNGNPANFWHTVYGVFPAGDPYPHEVQLDMGANSVLSGFTYLPRQDAESNGLVAQYNIYVSNTIGAWGDPVASGTWTYGTAYSDRTLKTVTFSAKQGRYLRFVAVSSANGLTFASAAGIGVLRTTATASSQEVAPPGNFASYAVDGRSDTFWHTKYTGGLALAPHHITLDLGIDSNVSGLIYLPRQSGGLNGTITGYQIYVSNSNTNWGAAVKTGIWQPTNSEKTESFAEKRGRYLRLVATSASGGSLASAAEITVVRTINIPCTKTITINVDTKETYTFNDGTWSPGDPNGNATANDIINIVSGDAEFSGAIRCGALTVEAGASLTINSGAVLTANTTTLRSESNKFSSLIVDGEIIGVVNYERYVNVIGTPGGGGNDLVSPPLEDGFFNKAFVITNPNLPENLDPAMRGEFAFAPFNIQTNAYENFNIGADSLGEIPFVSGKGYRAATEIGSTLNFTGTAAATEIDIAISDESLGRAWNLIGNPYPAYLNFEMFFAANANEFDSRTAYQAIYGYTGASSTWTTWNQATIDDPAITNSITPGQGFFVKAKSGGGLVKFTTDMRITGSSDDFILGRPNKNIALSKLKLSSAAKSGVTSIYFIDGTTRGLDPGYDAAAYGATKVDFSMFTNLLEDNTGLDIAIQSLPFNDFNEVVVPLGIKAKVGTELSISIDERSTIPSSINVYLEDTQNNTFTLLNSGNYTFTVSTDVNGSDRFNVHYSSRILSVGDMQSRDTLRIYATASPKTLFIKGQLANATTANLYDIQGRLVLRKVLNLNSTENTMDISTVSTGVYVVKVKNDNQVKTQKVIIK